MFCVSCLKATKIVKNFIKFILDMELNLMAIFKYFFFLSQGNTSKQAVCKLTKGDDKLFFKISRESVTLN